jgi:23S rRNA (guanosine2251-2'-O)-methyltransferase
MMAGGSFFEQVSEHPKIYVVVENVRSLFNVGAIFRSADGAGASGVILTGFTGTPPRREISLVALGAEGSIPWVAYPTTEEAILDLRHHGISVVALESTDGSIDYLEAPVTFPVAIVVGHEVEGVMPTTLEACDYAIHLPMYGKKISLNVSVAAGIALYGLRNASSIRSD